MGRALKREAAKRDLRDRWTWYAENANIEIADRFLAAAERALSALARHPESGVEISTREASLRGMRRFPIGDGFEKNLLFYFPRKNGIELVRVLHGSRDLKSLFFSRP